MASRFDRLIRALAAADLTAGACNQYESGTDSGNRIRRANLRHYLEEMDPLAPTSLLIGEAPSHRGGCRTGIPFLSEALMCRGVTLPSGLQIFGTDHGYRKATNDEWVSTEASATIIWSTIASMHPLPLLWNAFPFHPFQPGNRASNRLPTRGELKEGQRYLGMLLDLFAPERVVAIGNSASHSLTLMGVEHSKVRHPSQGGKPLFVAGMAQLSQSEKGRRKP